MKLRVAALILVELACCAHSEPPTRGATQPAASASALPSSPAPGPNAVVPIADAAPAISASSPPLPPDTSDEPAPISVTNRNGLRGLVAALKDVDRVELLRWDHRAEAEPLSPADRARLLQLIGGGRLTDTHTVAHPPWPAALLFHTTNHGTYAVTLVGHSDVRLDAGGPNGHFEGAAARWNSSPPPEMALDNDDGWLWTFFESHLGPTREKEYLMPKVPGYLQVPQKP